MSLSSRVGVRVRVKVKVRVRVRVRVKDTMLFLVQPEGPTGEKDDVVNEKLPNFHS